MTRRRVVVDTNIFVSALLTPGNCRGIIELWLDHRCFDLVMCPRLFDELELVLRRRKISSLVSAPACNALLSMLVLGAVWHADPTPTARRLRDANDEFVAQLALDAQAELIISGDRDLSQPIGADSSLCLAPRDALALLTRWCA